MRVLLTTDPIGGVWTFTKDLASHLLAQGHAVALISFGRQLSPSQAAWCLAMCARYCDTLHCVASTVPLEWMSVNSGVYREALKPLLKLAREFSPDIIHSNQFCFGSLPLAVPVVVTAHSDVLSWAEACDPETLRPSRWLEQYKLLVQRGLDEAAAVVAPTQWMLTALGRHFQFAARTLTIANGRDLPIAPLNPRPMQAVSVGRLWDKGKNVALLTRVSTSVPLLIVGEQSHDGAQAPHVPEHLQMLGALDEAELITLFSKSSVYIAPSIYEPFGLAALEAALCGCAVLAKDIASLREVWGDAALYFQHSEALSEILSSLQIHEDRLGIARARSQNRARHLTAARMADAYLALYTSLLEQPLAFATAEVGTYAG